MTASLSEPMSAQFLHMLDHRAMGLGEEEEEIRVEAQGADLEDTGAPPPSTQYLDLLQTETHFLEEQHDRSGQQKQK